MRLNNREKFIAAAVYPTCGGFATREEVKKIKLKARGHYWTDSEFEQVVAVSPGGKRYYFEYYWYSWADRQRLRYWWLYAMRCGRLWAKGKCKAALKLYAEVDDS
jgi:hypothetical protein